MRRGHLLFLFHALAAGLWSCNGKTTSMASHHPDQVQEVPACEPISYERTACFGPCPVFEFNWDGAQNANLIIKRPFPNGTLSELEMGTFAASIPPARAQTWCNRLDSVVLALRYASLDSSYDNPRVTDLPAIITEINHHRVYNRMGGPNLTILYDELQFIMEDINWRSQSDL